MRASLPDLFVYPSIFNWRTIMEEYMYKVVNRMGGSCIVPPSSPYYLEYKKGEHVKAPEGALGIMVFSTEEQAAYFLAAPNDYGQIKRVVPIGEPTVPAKVTIWPHRSDLIKEFSELPQERRDNSDYARPPSEGTICYPEVIVVD